MNHLALACRYRAEVEIALATALYPTPLCAPQPAVQNLRVGHWIQPLKGLQRQQNFADLKLVANLQRNWYSYGTIIRFLTIVGQ